MERDSFIFYRSFFEASKPLSKTNKAELFNCICEFALNQTQTETKPIVGAMFNLIRPQLEANYNRYLSGSKGGRPRNETKPKPNHNQSITKPKPNVNVNDNVNPNVNDNKNDNEEKRDLVFPFTDEDFLKTWQLWKDYKQEQFNFKYKPIGEQAALKKLGELAAHKLGAVEIIHQSINNGWKGFFKLDKNGKGYDVNSLKTQRMADFLAGK